MDANNFYRGRRRNFGGTTELFPGCDFTDEEREFVTAMDRYKRENSRMFPTWREVLYVLIKLGWRKVEEAEQSSVKERIDEGQQRLSTSGLQAPHRSFASEDRKEETADDRRIA